ncbi:hypothetical protein B0J14DRAFT_662090 [Halenospora varia]|nr:hypothetical protein B0J14DRAFT_662090 [Halenospora varia]
MLFNKENGRIIDINDGKEVLKFINTFGLDNTVKSKPVLDFALILLLLLGTGYRPAELVDARKKKKGDVGSEDNDLKVVDDNFGPKSGKGSSGGDDGIAKGDVAMTGVKEDIRHFDALYYKDHDILLY